MNIGNIINIKFINIKSLFLDNKNIKQIIFKNAFWLVVGTGINGLLKLVLLIYVARILGATEYGKFTFALAFVSLFVVFSDFGLSTITTREFSRVKEGEFPAVFSLKILLSLGTLILILISSFFITADFIIRKIIWILAIWILTENFSEIIFAFFRTRLKMEYEALARTTGALLVTGVGFFVILNFPSIQNISYSYLFAALSTLVFVLLFFHFKIYSLKIKYDRSIWQKFLTMSWPLGLAGIFGMIFTNIDSVIMGHWGQIAQVGFYNAAYKIVSATLIPMSLISASFFPVLSKYLKESKEKLQEIWNYQLEIMVVLAIPLVVGGIVLAPKIINFIYDPSFTPSIFALQLLIVMGGLIFLHNSFSQILIVFNQQTKFFWTLLSGAIVNVILNLILIPKFSLYGAASSAVITHFFIFFLLLNFTFKFTSVQPFNLKLVLVLLGAIFSSFIMYLILTQSIINQFHIVFLILIGVTVYLFSFFIYKKLINQIIEI
jgi:O-antigen/teichoic acid export membrane protein